jgi:hypothetical protein
MDRMRWLVLLAMVALPMGLRAQVGVYGGFSATKLDVPQADWIEGASFGAYYNTVHLPVVNFGFDLRGSVLGGGGATQVKSGLAGPRVVAHLPVVPLHPYVEGLVGAGDVKFGQGLAARDATHLGYGLAAGVDFTFFPRLDWRVVDYQWGHYNGVGDQSTITTGLVLRLPIP